MFPSLPGFEHQTVHRVKVCQKVSHAFLERIIETPNFLPGSSWYKFQKLHILVEPCDPQLTFEKAGSNNMRTTTTKQQQAQTVLSSLNSQPVCALEKHNKGLGGDGIAIEDETEVPALTLHTAEGVALLTPALEVPVKLQCPNQNTCLPADRTNQSSPVSLTDARHPALLGWALLARTPGRDSTCNAPYSSTFVLRGNALAYKLFSLAPIQEELVPVQGIVGQQQVGTLYRRDRKTILLALLLLFVLEAVNVPVAASSSGSSKSSSLLGLWSLRRERIFSPLWEQRVSSLTMTLPGELMRFASWKSSRKHGGNCTT
ncbi:hypothetical protein EYF80_005676 [Liparis tanakae]|uniref:Uncharacterized protein n=1 Tax=Liparis tanakae TaxID=230148 RepID=A0A4Z2J1B0_9TELE|nr:hypothetical protein EYF80_005676 [Liparis tanakae]